MSAPPQKLPPAPVRITTRTSVAFARAVKISPRPRHIDSDTALRFSGRFRVTTAMPARVST